MPNLRQDFCNRLQTNRHTYGSGHAQARLLIAKFGVYKTAKLLLRLYGDKRLVKQLLE